MSTDGVERGAVQAQVIDLAAFRKEPAALFLTPDQWAARDIPPIDWRLGSLFSTSSRAMLIGPTGAGKTMLGLAWSYAMATGEPFLHWGARKPTRVAYIDGELQREDISARLELAASWFERDPGDNLRVFSTDDLEEPLNLDTEEGARFIGAAFDALKPEFATFDNLSCLTAGSMKEPESERRLRVLRQTITKAGCGQLWLHHTGHDVSKGYGDKTREWGLDTVMLMEDMRRGEDDVRFKLDFTKARRRSPKTRGSYEPRVLALEPDLTGPLFLEPQGRWVSLEAVKELTGPQKHVLSVLRECGEPKTDDELEAMCDPARLAPKGRTDDAPRKAFVRAREALVKLGKIHERADGRLSL